MNTYELRRLLDEIDEKCDRLRAGASAWSKGTDEFAMADCDPGIQYELANKIEALEQQIRTLVMEALQDQLADKPVERVIQECISVIDDVSNCSGQGAWYEGYLRGIAECKRRVEEHFGVDE